MPRDTAGQFALGGDRKRCSCRVGTRVQEKQRKGNVQESKRDDWQGLAENLNCDADGEYMRRDGEQYGLQDQDCNDEKAIEKEHEKSAAKDLGYQRYSAPQSCKGPDSFDRRRGNDERKRGCSHEAGNNQEKGSEECGDTDDRSQQER